MGREDFLDACLEEEGWVYDSFLWLLMIGRD